MRSAQTSGLLMPIKPGKPCRAYPCKVVVHGNGSYCKLHQRELTMRWANTTASKDRAEFYSSNIWKGLRRLQLDKDPYCAHCARANIQTIATIADHILDRVDRPDLSYDIDNLQSLCPSCHNRKTRVSMNARYNRKS